jgi:hypothetical protein
MRVSLVSNETGVALDAAQAMVYKLNGPAAVLEIVPTDANEQLLVDRLVKQGVVAYNATTHTYRLVASASGGQDMSPLQLFEPTGQIPLLGIFLNLHDRPHGVDVYEHPVSEHHMHNHDPFMDVDTGGDMDGSDDDIPGDDLLDNNTQ